MASDALRIDVLGPLRVRDGHGRDAGPEGELQRRLLALLVLRRGEVVSVDEAVEALWPRSLPRNPAAALQTHVFRLRRSLPEGVVTSAGSGYRLDPAAVEIDADRVAGAVHGAPVALVDDPASAVAVLDEALALWRGPAYLELADTDDGRREASRLEELRVRAREVRAEALLKLGRADEVVAELTALADEHPLRERPRSLLMAALAATGRSAEALRVYDDFRRRLADELGVEPSPALAAQQLELLGGTTPGSHTLRRQRLPVLPTSLIGRDELIDQALAMADAHRIVTMLGPGGVGKTRLLLEVGRRLASDTTRPVVLCELGAADEGSATEAVAAAFGVDRRLDTPLVDRVVAVVGDAPVVVLLDNCEHVLDAVASFVEALVSRCPGLVVLATSRERLRVTGEHLCPVPPLPLIDGDGPAVSLFVARARAVRPAFDPGPAELARVAEIVRRLDGLPLAIELAAARLQTLDIDEVAAGLDRRFRLLASGTRTSPRHRSLGAAVAWSYDLLDAELQRVLDDVSVYSTPFDTRDAAVVTGLDEAEVADALAALAERSLLTRLLDGRSVLSETLREFGAERLAERGDREVRVRHARHQVTWLQDANHRLRDPEGVDALSEIDRRLPEVRVALSWLLDHDQIELAGCLVRELHEYGLLRLRPDVLAWADRVRAADPDDRSPVAARMWAVGAAATWMAGDIDECGRRAERAWALGGETDEDASHIAQIVGSQALFEGRLDDAVHWYWRSRALADPPWSLFVGGTEVLALAYANHPDASAVAQALLAETGDDRTPHAAFAWYAAGEAELSGDVALARQRFGHALALAEATGASFVTGVAGSSAASIDAREGDPVAAAASYRWLIDHWRRAGMWATQWTMLRSIALLLDRLDRRRQAAVLVGAVTSTRAGHRLFGEDEAAITALGARLCEVLGAEEYESARTQGAMLDGDAAVEHALRSLRLGSPAG